jgi:penicillin amidase
VTLIVPRRNQGPIVALDLGSLTAISVQYTGFSATRELDAFLLMSTATNLQEFRTALEYYDHASQNFSYTDIEGNIAFITSAEMPIREDLQAGTVNGLPPWFIRNGTGGNEWLPVQNPQPNQVLP